MRTTSIIFLMLALLCMSAEPPPSAKEILDSVRLLESRQQIDLQGQLRQEDMVIPFRLMQNGPLSRYTCTNPDESLELQLGGNSSRFEAARDAGTDNGWALKLARKLRDTTVR